MRARTLLSILTLAAVCVCTAVTIQGVRSTRHRKRIDKEALSRWEGEGGPPPPSDDDHDVSAAAG